LRNKDFLYKEYIVNSKSATAIAKELNVTREAVLWYLDKFDIPKRSMKEAQGLRKRELEKPNIYHTIY
jgi:predicted transcriptional regulator